MQFYQALLKQIEVTTICINGVCIWPFKYFIQQSSIQFFSNSKFVGETLEMIGPNWSKCISNFYCSTWCYINLKVVSLLLSTTNVYFPLFEFVCHCQDVWDESGLSLTIILKKFQVFFSRENTQKRIISTRKMLFFLGHFTIFFLHLIIRSLVSL